MGVLPPALQPPHPVGEEQDVEGQAGERHIEHRVALGKEGLHNGETDEHGVAHAHQKLEHGLALPIHGDGAGDQPGDPIAHQLHDPEHQKDRSQLAPAHVLLGGEDGVEDGGGEKDVHGQGADGLDGVPAQTAPASWHIADDHQHQKDQHFVEKRGKIHGDHLKFPESSWR